MVGIGERPFRVYAILVRVRRVILTKAALCGRRVRYVRVVEGPGALRGYFLASRSKIRSARSSSARISSKSARITLIPSDSAS